MATRPPQPKLPACIRPLPARRALLAAGLITPVTMALAQVPSVRERVIYGGDAAFAPFESLDGQGQPTGFQLDLLQELGQVTDMDFDIRLADWSVTETRFRDGELDLIALVDTPERRAWARFAQGHATPVLTVYTPEGTRPLQDVPDLLELRLAVLDSDAMTSTLRTWLPPLAQPPVRHADPQTVLQAVLQGQADAALMPRAYAEPLLSSGRVAGIQPSGLNLRLQAYGFAVAPGNERLLARIEQGLQTLEAQGRLDALRTRWLGSHLGRAERQRLQEALGQQARWTWQIGLGAGLGVAVLGALSWRRGRQVLRERQARHRAELALQKARDLLEHSFTRNDNPMLLVDAGDGHLIDANRSLADLLGLPVRELRSLSMRELGERLDTGLLRSLVTNLQMLGRLSAWPLRVRDAQGRWCEALLSVEPARIAGQPQLFCVLRDISAQLAKDAALAKAYASLAIELTQARAGQTQAEQALETFTRGVSHDLRTPLLAAGGLTDLLQQSLQGGHADDAVIYVEHIRRATQRMAEIVDALSRLARLGQHVLQRQSVDMAAQAREIWSLLAVSHPQRSVGFALRDLPDAPTDAALSKQVWQNLLQNAWKYSERNPDAKVAVDSFAEAGRTWYRVTDNGAGFDMARADRLFQPFQRMHGASEFEGSGVGLSLVHRIVVLHGGDIRLRSKVGIGTVAEFTLEPTAAPAPPAATGGT